MGETLQRTGEGLPRKEGETGSKPVSMESSKQPGEGEGKPRTSRVPERRPSARPRATETTRTSRLRKEKACRAHPEPGRARPRSAPGLPRLSALGRRARPRPLAIPARAPRQAKPAGAGQLAQRSSPHLPAHHCGPWFGLGHSGTGSRARRRGGRGRKQTARRERERAGERRKKRKIETYRG